MYKRNSITVASIGKVIFIIISAVGVILERYVNSDTPIKLEYDESIIVINSELKLRLPKYSIEKNIPAASNTLRTIVIQSFFSFGVRGRTNIGVTLFCISLSHQMYYCQIKSVVLRYLAALEIEF